MVKEMKYNILIWGIGERTQNYIKDNYFENCNIVGFIDSNQSMNVFKGYKVYTPHSLPNAKEYDYIVICNQFFSEIFSTCLSIKVPREKLIFTDGVKEPYFAQNKGLIKKVIPKLLFELDFRSFSLISTNETDYWDEKSALGKDQFAHPQYQKDYFRFRTFELVSKQIVEENVGGAVAEFGVFRGSFAALINKHFKHKKLYLFDTFEGFNRRELEKEIELGRTTESFGEFYSDTTMERVISSLPYPDNIVMCKGLFPSSITEDAKSEQFAFVSIDVDFENSIYAGLEFFYPRLSNGGIIFIHDYNSLHLSGVKVAVERYECVLGYKLAKVPIADKSGTLVIIKSGH